MELVADVQRMRIAYRRSGQGPVLVFLHGFLCDSRVWKRQLADLSDAFTAIAWDAPGAGASADPREPFTTADYAICLASFLDAIGVEQAHVVGLSWGGILAQEFFRLFPSRVTRLILADTYAGWRGSLGADACNERLATCLADSTERPESLIAKFVPDVFSRSAPRSLRDEFAEIVRGFHPAGFRLMSLSSAEVDTRPLLPTIDVPTLLLWGDDDRRSPLHIAGQFRAAIPGAELAVIRNAGHLSNMEQPAAFNAHVRRFCMPG